MNDKARYGKRIFSHYLSLIMREAGGELDWENLGEIEAAIDDIVEAAVAEAVARLAEMEAANPHDADSPGHPCGYALDQEQRDLDETYDALRAQAGYW